MSEKKLKVVHFLNQFFGQVGGEDKATTGFVVKQGPVGPVTPVTPEAPVLPVFPVGPVSPI